MSFRFYKELNNLSTAELLIEPKKKESEYYEIERTISRRTRKGKVRLLFCR